MRILGIDLGSSSVKAVELDSAFGRYEIHEYHEQPIEPGVDPFQAARQLIQGLPKAPDRIAVALRTSQVTFRNLQLPTRDKKAIQASVGFELDDDLPFAIEQAIYDYAVLSQAGNATHVHVAATLSKHVGASLAQWNAAGIDPDLVTTEAWAYRTHLNRILSANSQEHPVLLIQIGHERTTLYVHWRGFPVVARDIAWGGRDLTTAICRKYGIPLDQAESAKLDHGFVLSQLQREQASQEQIEFSDTLHQAIDELLLAIRQTLLTCKNATHQNLSTIYLSGGSSLLPGLGRLLEDEIKVPVHSLQALSSIATSGVTYSESTDGRFLLAVSLAMCLVGAERSNHINLRKGLFAKQGRAREMNLATLKGPMIALGAISACLIGSLVVQSRVYESRLKETNSQLERSVRSFFGQISPSGIRTYMNNTTSLRNAINQELGKQREMSKLLGANPKSPTQFLKEMSVAVPRDVVVDMTRFQVGSAPTQPYSAQDGGSASLTFLVTNPQMAEKLADILGKKLTDVQRSKMEEVTATDGTAKRYKITFSGKPMEDAYGK